MANKSILDAFERFWQHTIALVGTKADLSHIHNASSIAASDANEGQILRVVNGVATWTTIPNAEDATF